MSSEQLDEWIAFYSIEPWGLEPLDWLLAHFKALFVNANMMKKKKPYKAEKMLCFFGKHGKEVEAPEPGTE